MDPGTVAFLFGFSFHNIMFMAYIKFERINEKKYETVAFSFKFNLNIFLFYVCLIDNIITFLIW